MSNKLVVIGLDGATWDLLDPMIDAGKLPNMARISKEGVRGDLESVRPPISCPAWFCYSTGKNPGKLGIFGWRNFDPATKSDHFNGYDRLDAAEVWDYLGRAGLRSAVINIPTMFPPKAIEGYMVSGMQAEEHQQYTHPPELKQELKDRFGYQVSPRHKMLWDYEEGFQEAVDLFQTRFDAALHLLDDVDLLHVTIFHIDEVQHSSWGTENLERAWEVIDEQLGRFLDELPDGTDVLFMSDHGFVGRREKLYINTWLEREGYLTRDANRAGETLRKLGINRQGVERVLRKFNALELAKKLTPDRLQQVVKERDGTTSNQRRLVELDWSKTVAFASTKFTLHVLDPEKIDEIKARMEALTAPDGTPFFEEVLRYDDKVGGEPVLHGDRMAEAPQLLYVPAAGMAVGDALGHEELWETLPETAADHDMHGIVMAQGPTFQGQAPQDARLVDLAPTILHYFGLPVPEDMDGRVLTEVFSDPGEVTYTSEETSAGSFSDQELEKVEERLRGLGYLE